MFELEISDKDLKKIETFFSETPKIIQKIIKKSLSRTVSEVNKFTKKGIKNKYQVDNSILSSKNILIKRGNNEVSLLASSSPQNIDDFYVSLRKPKAISSNIKAAVFKNTSPKDVKNMFWAFYKKDTSSLGLFKRVGTGREIKKVKSPSVHNMASGIDKKDLENNLQNIFNETLEKVINEEMGKL